MKAKSLTILISTFFICFYTTLLPAVEKTPDNNNAQESSDQAKRPEKQDSKGLSPKTTFSSVEERRLYAILENERGSMEEEKKVLALREKELKTLEVEADKKLKLLDEKLDKLKKVQKKIESLLAEKDVEEQKKIQDLGMIYAKMTPARAALALSALDVQLAADLLANMKVKSAAKILDRMDKAKATQLSTTFTTIIVE